ncbi:MAG: DUF1223 domain-containing protein [Burkholderiales bacterium]
MIASIAVHSSSLAAQCAKQSPPHAVALLELYTSEGCSSCENRLSTDVKAGENRGVTLRHDYVVREWIGPIEVAGDAELRRTLALERDWQIRELGVAAFVQDSTAREGMQATALAVCGKG